MPRAVWPNVSQRVAAQLGVRRVFLQTSSASAAVAYSSAATSLGLTVSYTENRRSEHDEWGGWSNGTNAMWQSALFDKIQRVSWIWNDSWKLPMNHDVAS